MIGVLLLGVATWGVADEVPGKGAKLVEEKQTEENKTAAVRPASPSTDASREKIVFFETKIRPVLAKHCYSCHSQDAKELGGNLLLDSREGMLAGGQSGPSMVVGKAHDSLIIQALQYDGLEMPPDQPLPERVIADFVKWVEMGAPDPRKAKTGDAVVHKVIETDHWAFQPITRLPPPQIDGDNWSRDDIDRFLYAKLIEANLRPVADADARTLIIRLSADLTGLPPTPDQIVDFQQAFQKDRNHALEKLVDELLNSSQFGVRWGRYWLDVARYGDSNGVDGLSRNPTYPHAWRYRDYVIDALNADVPYDRFLTEQIAGDLLAADSLEERERLWIATGFLTVANKPAFAMNVNFRMDIVADQIDAVCTAFMGFTVACARCHDHKHDPIPTRDYYALAGIFTSTETLYGLAANENLSAPKTDLYVLTSERYQKKTRQPDREPVAAETSMDDAVLEDDKKKADDKAQKQADGKQAKGEKSAPKPDPRLLNAENALAMGVREGKEPEDCKINIQGESTKLGPRVPRGALTAAWQTQPIEIPDGQSGRLQLARWLTAPDHPLTARVMANRVWLHLFGRGLVPTCDDFGLYGLSPSHPELLDHLATRFVDNGWSVKKLIRAIVLSRAYQLSSAADPQAEALDPENKLVWCHSRRRLDAEAFRDKVLAVSGQLDLGWGGPSAVSELDVLVNKSGNLHKPTSHRSIYLCYLRNSQPVELEPFDLPDFVRPQGQREVSTVAGQGLFLLNSPLVVEQSEHFANRVGANSPGSVAEEDVSRIGEAYRLALLREPHEDEVQRGTAFLNEVEQRLESIEKDPVQRRMRAWSGFCQALLVTNEFRYVD